MTMIKIKMNTGNSAFDNGKHCKDFEHGRSPLTSYDINGNRCVTVEYTGKDR